MPKLAAHAFARAPARVLVDLPLIAGELAFCERRIERDDFVSFVRPSRTPEQTARERRCSERGFEQSSESRQAFDLPSHRVGALRRAGKRQSFVQLPKLRPAVSIG